MEVILTRYYDNIVLYEEANEEKHNITWVKKDLNLQPPPYKSQSLPFRQHLWCVILFELILSSLNQAINYMCTI